MVQVLRPSGLRCTTCWRVSPTARTPLHLSALCPLLETSLFHVYTTTLPVPHPTEQLGRDAVHNFLDALGEAHRCDFTCCLDFKDCETHFNSSQAKVKANKKYFIYGIQTELTEAFEDTGQKGKETARSQDATLWNL